MTTLWKKKKKQKTNNMEDIFDEIESDIDLGIDLSNYEERENDFHEEKKSNHYEGFDEARRGNYNASEAKGLMSCSQKWSKHSWHNPEKVLGFSDGSVKYIFKKAKERETGRTIKTASSLAMKYGSKIEELTFRRANEYLKPLGLYAKKVGYKKFDSVPTAGASSDAIICEIETDKIIASGEMKACVSWETLYERTFEATDEKSIDFWQTQQQMVAWNVDKTYYFVISPPSGIMEYLNSDNIDDLYEDWIKETEMEVEIIQKSDIHADNLLKRISIAEETIKEYLETKENIKEILYKIIDREKGLIPKQSVDIQEPKEDVSRETLSTEDIVSQLDEFDTLEIGIHRIPEIEKKEETKKITSIDELDDDLPF